MLLSISKPQGNEAIQCHPVWEMGFKHEFPPWPLLCSLTYSHETWAKGLLHSLWPPHRQLPFTWAGKYYFLSLSFPLTQLNAKTDNDSLGLKVRRKTTRQQKGLFEKQHIACYTDSFKACSCNWKYPAKHVYNKSLLQLWFQAHGCYFYVFLLNKTVKIKNKFQAE